MQSSRRDHLVDTAQKLFCRHGFRATGIDRVLAESGVAKKTLYNHFKSKDELIIAVLKKRDAEFMDWMGDAVTRLAPEQDGDPEMARVLAFFAALGEWISGGGFSGCTFINASAEFPRCEDPIHIACENHKRLVLHYLEELLGELALQDCRRCARQLSLLAEGAIVTAHTCGDPEGALLARDTARQLLESAPRRRQAG